jgi:hypothetical protein
MPRFSCPQTAAIDPVLFAFELPLRRTFYPFGFPVELETNSPEAIAAASEGWEAFDPMFDAEPVRLCLGVLPGSGDARPLECAFRSREHLMSMIADPENFVVCDFNRGFAFGWVTQNTAADHPSLRYHFLTAAAASLIEQRACAAVHGALVERNAKGVMLAGDSLAGKSTLAYACARAGWTYLGDDCALLVRERDDRCAVGDPHTIRLRADAPELFPELANHLPSVRPNGKIAIEIRTRELAFKIAPACQVEHVVYLNREQPRDARLRRISKERVRADWEQYNVLGTREARVARRHCHERFLSAQLWEMRYSDLDEAVTRLERLVDEEG